MLIKPAGKGRAALTSGRGKGFGARGIGQPDTAMHDLDHPVALEFGEGTADRLDGEAEVIGYILPAHRQRRYRGGRTDQRHAVAPFDQETRNLLFGGPSSEQDHLLLRLREFPGRRIHEYDAAGAACFPRTARTTF